MLSHGHTYDDLRWVEHLVDRGPSEVNRVWCDVARRRSHQGSSSDVLGSFCDVQQPDYDSKYCRVS